MVTTNAVNNRSAPFTVFDGDLNISAGAAIVDPGAATDSYIQFNESTTGKWRIGNDATDDSYRLSQGSALGTNDTFIMTTAGENTLPLQPAFLAYLETTDNNVTGNGTFYALGTNTALTEVYDQNSDFDVNGTFTAPVTGKYMLACFPTFTFINPGTYRFTVRIVTSSRSYQSDLNCTPNLALNQESNAVVAIADMDASDTATFEVYALGKGADTVAILGWTYPRSYVCGKLVC